MMTKRGASVPGGLTQILRLLTSAAVVTALVALPFRATAAETTGIEYVDAVADGSLAHIQVTWKGWLVVQKDVPLWGTYVQRSGTFGPYTATVTCSGFVASPDGNVVTAGHCVDAQNYIGGKGAVLAVAMGRWHDPNGNLLGDTDRARLTSILQANADIEGADSGSGPERTVEVTVPALSQTSHPANVVDVQPFTEGDVALLSVTGLSAPVLTVAGSTPERGVGVVAAGFSGSVNQIVDATTAPTFNSGNVSGTETVNGTPFTQISARTSPGMSGGPVLDTDGNVVGTVSWSPTSSDASDFMTSRNSIASILSGNGVTSVLGAADTAYRQGLTYYYDGRYHDAAASFDEALALQPTWTMLSTLKQQAVAKYPDEVTSSGFPLWAFLALGGGIVVIAAVGVGAFLLIRRRGTPPAGQPTTAFAPPGPTMTAPPPTAPPPTAPAPTAPAWMAPPPPPPTAPPPTAPAPAGPAWMAPEVTPVVAPPAPVAETVTPAAETEAPVVTAPTEGEHHAFCPNCGVKHALEAHYCEECGQPLAAATPSEHEVS